MLHLLAVAFAGPAGGETDGFMLLDYCPVTLLDIMQRSNFNLDAFMVFEVFSEVCSAVAHMHRQAPPLTHRCKVAALLRHVLRFAGCYFWAE